MKEIDFLDAVGRVDKQYIEECITYKPPKRMNVWIKRMSAIAACFMVIIGAVLIVNHMNQPVIIDENGFYIENGVLLRYTGSETDVTIPEEVETIADFTFLENKNASKIEIVRLGASVQKVETNAFAGLENLVDLIIAENNLSFVYEDGLIMTSDGSILLRYEREDETHFTIPESVRFVAAHAVQATELEEIDFGENIEYIGYYAFSSNGK
ncbi:MAG: leucine-rich repeat protein, partial [Kiritimatiellae bacterium]|nr:leucine-rich repeat protein [Kiritimatiellia bacterium]